MQKSIISLSVQTRTLTTVKRKTECMALTKKERDLRSMILCGNSLPWVKSTHHLGNKIEDEIDGTRQDMREKVTVYPKELRDMPRIFFCGFEDKNKIEQHLQHSLHRFTIMGSILWRS